MVWVVCDGMPLRLWWSLCHHIDGRLVMGLACVWLVWAVLLWGWAGRMMRQV